MPSDWWSHNAGERPLIAAARHERLEMPAMNFDDVRSGRMHVERAQHTVDPRAGNERVAATKHKDAVGRKTAEVLCWMSAEERFRVMRKPVSFLQGPMFDDPRGEALPDHEIASIR